MKQFFGAFFGSIVGIVVATLLALVVVIVVVKSSFNDLSQEDDKPAKKGTVLKLIMDGPLTDREALNPFQELGNLAAFGEEKGMGLNVLIQKIKDAQGDESISGIYLGFKEPEIGFAALEELRNALLEFKKSGKFIYAYAEYYTQKHYYLASVSNKVFLNPQGMFDWKGLHMNLMFFKQTFEKLDIDVQVFRHGKFKSAVEPFLLDKMSEANRLQSESFLNSIWGTMLNNIAKERKLTVDELNAMANQLSILQPTDALGKFVDALAYEDEVMNELKAKTGLKESDKLSFMAMSQYKNTKVKKAKAKAPKIAVVYAIGGIGSGEGDDEEIGSERLAKAIREARMDSNVKAVVLRVNSPGGSALASDVIWREMTLCKQAKPTIVSMGNVAASGGYYISCAADRIFAQPNTITGSIGVFGLLPSFKRMFENKLGITLDTVNTNAYSDIASGLRPLTQTEINYIQNSVEAVYNTFTLRVAEGRNMSQAEVDSIGQGRVWSGSEALKIKLVDELGGLDDAIAYAAKKANAADFKILELPKQSNPLDAFMGKKETELETRLMQKNLGATYKYLRQLKNISKLNGVQARLPFEMEIE
ncbi:MAG: signal peptide peptidase SppA [Bacteroidia bacterium]|jgi:protease-4|nr:signal peptide peptidase SppA [Bacteroidia bacterium]